VTTVETKKPGPQDLKKQRGFISRTSLREIFQQGAGRSGAPVRGQVATSESAFEISAKGGEELAVKTCPR
jgi:hypothetical protein